MFYDADGRLVSMLSSWTNIDEADIYAQGDAGRSWFRTDDLCKLRSLLDEITARGAPGVK